jgi:CRP-like cAMP-binding protein
VVTATPLSECRLLRIDREDFFDLLADHIQITQGVFKTVVKRLRTLMQTVSVEGTENE